MKQVISYAFAKDLGLLDDPYKKRRERLYGGQFLFEGWHQSERRREIAEVGARADQEAHMRLPNCVDKDLMLFEFEEEQIKQAVSHKNQFAK